MKDLVSYLKTRRSLPIPALDAPAPSGSELFEILTIASRVPDHGKLAPWRFIVYRDDASAAIGRQLADLVEEREGELGEARRHAEENRFSRSPIVIGVISTATDHPKIPVWEQQLAAGAVCLNLIHAANGKGYAATWITEWVAYDPEAKAILGIKDGENVAGFIHMGTGTMAPSERPRPDLSKILTVAEPLQER